MANAHTFFVALVCFLLVFLVVFRQTSGRKCHSAPNKTIRDVTECIKHDYDNVQRPNGTDDKALRVSVDLVVISIGTLNDIDMDYTLEFYMRQRWIDPLLRFDEASLSSNATYAILDQNLIQYLWKPDTYIENMKSIRYNFQVGPFINQGLRLFPNGMVLISSRISATMTCAMEFHNFPMDKQQCFLTLSSYFFPESDLYYEWGEVTIFEGVEMNNQFDILGVQNTRSSLTFSSGVYSSLKAVFKFRRRIQNFLLGFYIPSILTVMLSWVSFFISPNSAPARCALGIITVLAIGGFLTGQRNSFPTVSYVTAADLFILTCYVFAFLALLEYAAVHYLFVYKKQLYQLNRNTNQTSSSNKNEVIIDEGEYEPEQQEEKEIEKYELPNPKTSAAEHPPFVVPFQNKVGGLPIKKEKKWILITSPVRFYQKIREDALIIDKVARIAFPLSFALFNVVYWSFYKLDHNSDDI